MSLGRGLGIGFATGNRPSAVLQRLSPVYLRTTPFVGDGSTWEDAAGLLGLSGATVATVVVAFTPDATDASNTFTSCDVADFVLGTGTTGSGTIVCLVENKFAYITQPDANAHYFTALFRGAEATDAARLRLWLDGAEKTGGDITHSVGIAAAIPALTTARIGARTNDAQPLNGTIHCVAAYASDQSANLDAIHAAVATFLP